jgi:hypothetical protein
MKTTELVERIESGNFTGAQFNQLGTVAVLTAPEPAPALCFSMASDGRRITRSPMTGVPEPKPMNEDLASMTVEQVQAELCSVTGTRWRSPEDRQLLWRRLDELVKEQPAESRQ